MRKLKNWNGHFQNKNKTFKSGICPNQVERGGFESPPIPNFVHVKKYTRF